MNSQIGQHENVQNIIDENEINFKNNNDEQNMPTHQHGKQEVHIRNIEKIDHLKIFIDHLIQNKEKVMLICLILGLCGLIVKIII
jgi:hypothetical protein